MITKAKIVATNADPLVYHKQEAERGTPDFIMSASALKLFAQCAARWHAGYNPPDSDAKDDGSLFDTRLLTPKSFLNRYAIRPDNYETTGMECPQCHSVTDSKSCSKCKVERVKKVITKPWNGNATECADWITNHADREITTADDVAECDKAIEAFRRDEILASFVDASEKQVQISAEWHDPNTGSIVPLKALLDLVPRSDSEFASSLGDVKRTRTAALRPWSKWCFTAGYYLQAAFYADLMNAADPAGDRNTFCFLLSENYPPYQTGRRILSQDFLDMGRADYKRLLAQYCQCLKTGNWPGYETEAESVQGWYICSPEPWMAFEGLQSSMEQQQAEEIEQPDEFAGITP